MKNDNNRVDAQIYLLTREQFDASDCKNHWIGEGSSEWILFLCRDDVPQNADETAILQTIEEIITAIQTDVYVFGKAAIQAGGFFSDAAKETEKSTDIQKQASFMVIDAGTQVLTRFDETISALLIRRKTLINTGCFHEMLAGGNNLEFACRAADYKKIVWIETEKNTGSFSMVPEKVKTDMAKTVAYCCCKYRMQEGQVQGLDRAIKTITGKMQEQNMFQDFMRELGGFVQNFDLFYQYERNTAPIYIITGDDTAYGVLKDFAENLAAALAKKGQAVMTTDGKYIPYQSLADVENRTLKAMIGFQSHVLFQGFFRQIQAPKFVFWFDDPVFFDHLFDKIAGDDFYYMLCQDGFHAKHFQEHYQLKNACHFPPGGSDDGMPDFENRDLDVVFIGTWRKAEKPETMGEFAEDFCRYMLAHPNLSWEQGVSWLLKDKGLQLPYENYMELLWGLAPVYRYIRGIYRNSIVDSLLQAGIPIHVYGDSWKNYEPFESRAQMKSQSDRKNAKSNDTDTRSHLIIHPQVSPKEALDILRRSKLSLNIMSWHKAGMTERIIHSMLCGAVCVTDETEYLKEHFSDREMVMFQLCPPSDNRTGVSEGLAHPSSDVPGMDMYGLPEKIRSLLADDNKRVSMAKAAYQYAAREETWERRADRLLEMCTK